MTDDVKHRQQGSRRGKRKLKGLSPEIPIGKVDTLTVVENKTNVFAKREYIGFPGVDDHRMLHIDMAQSTWEAL